MHFPAGNEGWGKYLRLPLKLIPRESVIRVRTGPLKGTKWIAGSSTHGCWLGTYERDKQELFARLLRPGMTAYDIGANVGFYSLLSSRLVGPDGMVYAFEPVPRNLRYLREHVRLDGAENVRVVECAVGESVGVLSFDESHDPHTGRLAESGRLKVPVKNLDSLDTRPPDLIKMDIEGAEGAALRGAVETLKSHRPTILLATHGETVKGECLSLLTSLGYSVSPVGGRDDEFLGVPH